MAVKRWHLKDRSNTTSLTPISAWLLAKSSAGRTIANDLFWPTSSTIQSSSIVIGDLSYTGSINVIDNIISSNVIIGDLSYTGLVNVKSNINNSNVSIGNLTFSNILNISDIINSSSIDIGNLSYSGLIDVDNRVISSNIALGDLAITGLITTITVNLPDILFTQIRYNENLKISANITLIQQYKSKIKQYNIKQTYTGLHQNTIKIVKQYP